MSGFGDFMHMTGFGQMRLNENVQQTAQANAPPISARAVEGASMAAVPYIVLGVGVGLLDYLIDRKVREAIMIGVGAIGIQYASNMVLKQRI